MKKIVIVTIIFISIFSSLNIYAQDSRIDTTAIMILDKMADMIGELSSCKLTLNSSNDILDVELGPVKYFNTHNIYFKGPDKMLINTKGDKGHSGYWYDGSKLAYYSYSENNYAIIDAPSTIISTIDSINNAYGVDFPAADFFYPTFTDDLINQNDEIIFIGKSNIDGQDCFHIIAKNDYTSTQIWISDDALFLPLKYVVNYFDNKYSTQYQATFSNWELNPVLPDAMFNFNPPEGANKLTLVPKK